MNPLKPTIPPEAYAPAFTKPPRTPAKAKKPIPRVRSRPKKKKRSKGKLESVRHLKKRLWKLFAGYIKRRDPNCFTCLSVPEGASNQAGHFISAPHEATRFDPLNVHRQCLRCNVFLKGNIAEYAAQFLARYGREDFDALFARSRMFCQWTRMDLLSLIAALETFPERYPEIYSVFIRTKLGVEEQVYIPAPR